MQKLIEKLGLSEGAASAALWVVLSLILLAVVALLAVWLVRTLRPSLNINGAARGGRPQRLAITDAFALDREGRKLVIVRRDNTEHLLLIGGPNDVLVEANITRHDRAARGLGRVNEAPDDMLAEAPPVAAPVPPRLEGNDRPVAPVAPVVAQTPPVAAPPVIPPPAPVARQPEPVTRVDRFVPPPAPPAPPPAPLQAPPPMLSLEALLNDARPVTPAEPPAPPAPPAPAPVAPPAPAPVAPPAPAPASSAPPARPPAMSEMARRLNEALQKPVSGTLRPPFNRSIPPAPPSVPAPPASPVPEPLAAPAEPPVPEAPPAPPPAPAPAPAPTPAPEPAPIAKADMDLLEEEMARLLGRPAAPKKPEAT